MEHLVRRNKVVRRNSLLFLLVWFISACSLFSCQSAPVAVKNVYWFIPDGVRADPEEFDVFRWAEEGKLPNLKKMMAEGSYGFSVPDFPSHTPTNFATLLTGAHPEVHGIADGPMHGEGAPLERPSVSGFSSQAKRVAPVWTYLEQEYSKKVVLVSVPGSTPPELNRGITVKGRWGGWGADTPNLVFESKRLISKRKEQGKGFRLFYLGAPLTVFTELNLPTGWSSQLHSSNNFNEATLNAHGLKIFALLSKKQSKESKVIFSFNKGEAVAELKQGQWSEWVPTDFTVKGLQMPMLVRFKVIKLWPNGDFRVRVLFNQLNQLIVQPSYIADELTKGLGPMVDYADNWPHQLSYEVEDKSTFLDEAKMSLAWHRSVVPFVMDRYKPDFFIHDIYTPNLMLESRWWYSAIDKSRPDFKPTRSAEAWNDILEMYKGLDAILGEALQKKKDDSMIVFSSDHGVCHLSRLAKLNNFFAKKGWLKFKIDPENGESSVDWENSKVVYLKMAHIFISPKGLGGKWTRASGPEYDQLRQEVIDSLQSLTDENGKKPLAKVVRWEDAQKVYRLPLDRIGDLIIEANLGYFWHEEISKDLQFFGEPLTTGYKQSIDPLKNHCMWTPFVVVGPGVKKGFRIPEPISNADQLPTMLKLMGIPKRPTMQGRVVSEIVSP